jgi:hypothetical protein
MSGAQIPGARTYISLNFVPQHSKLLVPGTELSLFHPSRFYNFDVSLTFLVELCTPVLDYNLPRLKDSVMLCICTRHT